MYYGPIRRTLTEKHYFNIMKYLPIIVSDIDPPSPTEWLRWSCTALIPAENSPILGESYHPEWIKLDKQPTCIDTQCPSSPVSPVQTVPACPVQIRAHHHIAVCI